MKVIIGIIVFFIIVFVLIFLLAPIIGIFLVIKKSTEKKTPEFLHLEKLGMKTKVSTMAGNLSTVEFSVNDITNNLGYSFQRWTTNKLTGFIRTLQGENIIAFQRFDRGLKQHSRIQAISRKFRIFIETDDFGKTIEYDGVLLGKIDKLGAITNANGIRIATTAPLDQAFSINFISGKSAEIHRSYDRQTFVRNPAARLHKYGSDGRLLPQRISRKTFDPFPLTQINESDFTAEELKWITAIVVFTVIHQSFDFTS